MIRRPPRSTRTDTSFPTRRSSDLHGGNDDTGDRNRHARGARHHADTKRQPCDPDQDADAPAAAAGSPDLPTSTMDGRVHRRVTSAGGSLEARDRQSVVSGRVVSVRVDPGGRGIIEKIINKPIK